VGWAMPQLVEAEFSTPRLRAEISSFHWPKTGISVRKFDEYTFGMTLPSPHEPFSAHIDGHGRLLQFGSYMLLLPDLPLIIRTPRGRKRIFTCTFQRDFFREVTKLRPELNPEQTDLAFNVRCASIEDLMRRMYRELREPGFASEMFIESAGNLLLVEIARYFDHAVGKSACGERARGLASWQLRRIEERVRESSSLGYPTAAELAELCCVSEDHAMRSFKVSTGKTLFKYIEEQRLAVAKELLSASNLTVKEIATRLDFSSAANFGRAFRRLTAMTPRDYRLSMR
jgi:AraC family transcriptional regulator